MPISDRLKGLLNWWQLRIEKSREETKENDKSTNPSPTSSTSVCMGNNTIRQGVK